MDKKKHHISAPTHYLVGNSTSDSLLDPPPAYQPVGDTYRGFYHPTPAPQTVVINRQPTKAKDACCLGCLAALCLCFGAKECC